MTKAAEVKAEEVAAVSPELVALAGEAAALDGELGPAPVEAVAPGQEAAPAANEAEELAGILALCAAMVAPALPYVGEIYTPETCQRVAQAAVPVMEKYGLSTAGLFGRFGPEIGLAIVVAPLAVQTAVAHKAWKEKQRVIALRREADARQHLENTRNLEPGSLQSGGN